MAGIYDRVSLNSGVDIISYHILETTFLARFVNEQWASKGLTGAQARLVIDGWCAKEGRELLRPEDLADITIINQNIENAVDRSRMSEYTAVIQASFRFAAEDIWDETKFRDELDL